MTAPLDIKALLPVRWKRRLAVGAEHLVHMDERAIAWAQLLSSSPPAPGILYHAIPAGEQSQLVKLDAVPTADGLAVRVRVLHDFVARTPAGTVFVALKSESAPDQEMVAQVPARRGDVRRDIAEVKYTLLIGPRERLLDPDADRPDGTMEIAFSGLLGREVPLSYAGLATPVAESPENIANARTRYADAVAVASFRIQGNQVKIDDLWQPAASSLSVAAGIQRAPLDRLRQRWSEARATIARAPTCVPVDVGVQFAAADRARTELLAILSAPALLNLDALTPQLLWRHCVVEVESWWDRHAGDSAPNAGSPTSGAELAWGLVGTSDVVERASRLLESLINRRPWL